MRLRPTAMDWLSFVLIFRLFFIPLFNPKRVRVCLLRYGLTSLYSCLLFRV